MSDSTEEIGHSDCPSVATDDCDTNGIHQQSGLLEPRRRLLMATDDESEQEEGSNPAGGAFLLFFGPMFLIFMTLKLCGVVAWSWLWIAAPLWGPVVLLGLGIVMIQVIERVSDRLTESRVQKRRRLGEKER
jgi:hypothetical protein